MKGIGSVSLRLELIQMKTVHPTRPMVRIRRVRPEDWPHIRAIYSRARRDELRLAGMLQAFLPLEATAQSGRLNGGHLHVALCDELVCGFVAHRDDELTWLYVDPDHYRKGIGQALIRHVLKALEGEATATVLAGNEAALALCFSAGFEVLRRVDSALPSANGCLCHLCRPQPHEGSVWQCHRHSPVAGGAAAAVPALRAPRRASGDGAGERPCPMVNEKPRRARGSNLNVQPGVHRRQHRRHQGEGKTQLLRGGSSTPGPPPITDPGRCAACSRSCTVRSPCTPPCAVAC